MLISSRASRKIEEGSETKDTKVSLKHPTPRTGDDIVQLLLKNNLLKIWKCDISTLPSYKS